MEPIVITLSDGIYLSKDFPENILTEIFQELTIRNPAFIEAKIFQRSTKSIPEKITMYKETKESFRLPRGFLYHLIMKMKKEEISYKFINETREIEVEYCDAKIQLTSYQKKAVTEALKYRQGVIISPCGSGKTVMGILFLALAQQKTLWVTHTKELMYQTIAQIEKILTIPSEKIGKIGDGKKELGEKITVALVQSLVNYDKSILRDAFGSIIIDEAHRVPSKTFQKVVEISNAKFRLGLTATPKRKDGLEKILYHVVGQTVFQITEGDLLKEKQISIPNVQRIFTNFTSKKTNFQELMKQLIECRDRNSLIVETIERTLDKTEIGLLLSKRVAHCQEIAKLVHFQLPHLKIAVLTGKVHKQERELTLEKARNNELHLIIATQLADEGLDIPNLSKLYLTTPSTSKAKVKQQLGRIMRRVQNKQTPVVFDFVDVKVSLLRRQANVRNTVYHELGCNIFN